MLSAGMGAATALRLVMLSGADERLKLWFQAGVESVFICGLEVIPMTDTLPKQVNASHRNLLWFALGVPCLIISDAKLLERTMILNLTERFCMHEKVPTPRCQVLFSYPQERRTQGPVSTGCALTLCETSIDALQWDRTEVLPADTIDHRV